MKQVLITIMGAPGAGKGVQANLLSFKYGFFVIETSAVIERVIFSEPDDKVITEEGQSFSIKEERERWEKGELWHSLFVWHFVKKEIQKRVEEGRSIVFQGSPRTLQEAERFYPFVERLLGRENIFTFWLHITEQDSVFRNSHRRICELVRHPVLWLEDNKELRFCPLDGSSLIKRELDDPAVIKTRFEVYQNTTLPVLDWVKEHDYKVWEIDGRPSPSEVFSQIKGVLEQEEIR